MGHRHWSRAGLARRLCCAARCQGGQLADRKTAKGDAEVARRRPDCSTVTCVFCSYSKACEMGNVEVCCLLGDHTAARSRGREFNQALGVTVGAMSRRKRPKDAGRSTDCGRRPLELSSVEDAIQPGSQKADAPSSTPGTAIFMVLFLSTVLLRGTVGQSKTRLSNCPPPVCIHWSSRLLFSRAGMFGEAHLLWKAPDVTLNRGRAPDAHDFILFIYEHNG
ncbi:hypothetical protein GW17_00047570 [Ensete ventricosum]|nr:hypothetical protein GW17_00047570 [Ensete ventricosum]